MKALLCALAVSCAACVGTTGSDLVSFDAFAAGPADAVAGQDYSFVSDRGFTVTLHRAKLHVGAVYLKRVRTVSGAQATDCILPGIDYVAEVTQGLDVDILKPDLQRFLRTGEGTADHAIVGEVWLTYGDVNAPDDPGVVDDAGTAAESVLDVAGKAEKDGVIYPFEGTVSIGPSRAHPVDDPSMPSAHPICKERIVTPIDVDITPRNGGSLVLRIDPRGLFLNVDFSALAQVQTSPPLYRFQDDSNAGPDNTLFEDLRATSGVYQFSFVDSTKP